VRILLDESRCVGANCCELAAPDLFTVGEAGIAVIRRDPTDEEVKAAQAAMLSCPTMAITLQD
jgi:ferredoxin